MDLRWWFGIPVSGTVVSPRIATYRLQYSPTWLRTDYGELNRKSRGGIQAYSFGTDLLSGAPLSFSVAAMRSSSSVLEALGNAVETDAANFRAAASLNTRYLTAIFETTRRSYEGKLRALGVDAPPVLGDYVLRATRLTLSSSKLQVRISREINRSRQPGAEYHGWDLGGTHTFRWGRGSTLQSQFMLLSLQGDVPRRQEQWSERVHLHHARLVSSDHVFQRYETDLAGLGNQGWTWQSQFTASLRPGVGAVLAAERSDASAQETASHMTLVTPQLNLAAKLPLRVEVAATGSLGYEGRRVTGAPAFEVAVVSERYQVGPSRSFILRQPDVVATTVLLTGEAGGVRYVEGVDYLLVESGSFLQVLILTTGRIQEGSIVLASYRYLTRESPSVDAVRGSYHLSAQRGALQFAHSGIFRSAVHSASSTGQPDFNDFGNRRTELSLQTSSPFGYVALRASEASQVRHTGGSASRLRDRNLTFDLTIPLGAAATSLGAGWSQTRADSVDSRVLRGAATASWRLFPGLHVQGRFELLSILQQTIRSRYLTGSLEASWRPGRLEVDIRYDHLRRAAGVTSITNYVVVQVVRRF